MSYQAVATLDPGMGVNGTNPKSEVRSKSSKGPEVATVVWAPEERAAQ